VRPVDAWEEIRHRSCLSKEHHEDRKAEMVFHLHNLQTFPFPRTRDWRELADLSIASWLADDWQPVVRAQSASRRVNA
jgi:hypothetical protein